MSKRRDPDPGNAPSADRREWEESTLRRALDRNGERPVDFSTVSSMPVDRIYTAEDLGPEWNAQEKLGLPGEYPYTRGIHPTMYRGRLWTMRQFAGFGSAEATNRRFKYLLDHGQGGLSVAFDLPVPLRVEPVTGGVAATGAPPPELLLLHAGKNREARIGVARRANRERFRFVPSGVICMCSGTWGEGESKRARTGRCVFITARPVFAGGLTLFLP